MLLHESWTESQNNYFEENDGLFKGSGHYWLVLKIIVSIKTFLLTINRGLLIVKNIVRNGSLWSKVVFEKEFSTKIFEFDFETSKLDFEVSKSSICKYTTLCDNGVIFLQLRWPIFTGLLFCAYMNVEIREDWSLTITKGVQCL